MGCSTFFPESKARTVFVPKSKTGEILKGLCFDLMLIFMHSTDSPANSIWYALAELPGAITRCADHKFTVSFALEISHSSVSSISKTFYVLFVGGGGRVVDTSCTFDWMSGIPTLNLKIQISYTE